MRFVVTGTDTDIGKTVFAAGLCGFLGARYWKPVQAGVPGDRETVAALAGAVPPLGRAARRTRPGTTSSARWCGRRTTPRPAPRGPVQPADLDQTVICVQQNDDRFQQNVDY